MTRLQVRWASQHDWFLSSKWKDNGYEVTVRAYMGINVELKFSDTSKLKQWAGY